MIFVVDSYYSIRLLSHGFHFHRQSWTQSSLSLPLRLVPLLSHSASPISELSYWHREHTSQNSLPILFIHGIGVGLYTYVDFLAQLDSKIDKSPDVDEGEIGIIALELLPISSRICRPAMPADEMREAIRKIIDSHGWTEFVLVGHSYVP